MEEIAVGGLEHTSCRWFHYEISGLIYGAFSRKWAKTSCMSIAPRKYANAGA